MSIYQKKLSNNQHGFMEDKSWETNMISFYEEVGKTLDKGVAVVIIYLDFAKPFETVPHTWLECMV